MGQGMDGNLGKRVLTGQGSAAGRDTDTENQQKCETTQR
jgi:hypothetical protein